MTTKTIPDAAFIEKRVGLALKKAVEEGTVHNKNDMSRVLYLRPSSFSYCPLRAFFRLPTALSNGAHEPFDKAYYTSVGTTAHLVWQSVLETGHGRLVKDWLCLSKECRHRHSLVSDPKRCVKCGGKVKGVEHEIRLGVIRGHVDDILEVDLPNGEVGYIPIDYKSTSLAGLKYKRKNPGDAYVAQLSSYATILSRKLNVIGWCLVFFARDKPTQTVLYSSTKLLETSKLKEWSKQHRAMLRLKQFDDVKPLILNRACRTREDVEAKHKFCDFRSFCTHGDKTCATHAREVLRKVQARLPLEQYLSKD